MRPLWGARTTPSVTTPRKAGDSLRTRGGCPGSPRTIFLVRILAAHDGAAPEHHPVLRQRARLVGEDVLDLAQVLRDVEGTTLDGRVGLFVVQVEVVVQEEDLPELHQLDGHVQGDWDQHLPGEESPCVGTRPAPHLGTPRVGSRGASWKAEASSGDGLPLSNER